MAGEGESFDESSSKCDCGEGGGVCFVWWKCVQVHDSVKPDDISSDVTQVIGQAIDQEGSQGAQVEAMAGVRHRAAGVPSNPFEYAKFRNFTTFAEGTGCRPCMYGACGG